MERRRGTRIPTRLWTKVAGVDSDWVLRRGNVSSTGVYIEIESTVGELGSVQSVSIAPFDRSVATTMLMRLARVVGVHDVWRGATIAGIAFEFLPENEPRRMEAAEVVRRIVAARAYTAQSLELDEHLTSALAASHEDDGVASVEIVAHAPWPIGEKVRCQIETARTGRYLALAGTVTGVAADGARHRITITIQGGDASTSATHAEGGSISGAIDSLLDELKFPESGTKATAMQEHLSGSLERIELPSLLSFFELERLSGVLAVTDDDFRADLFIANGRLVDATAKKWSLDARGVATAVLRMKRGRFEFALKEIRVDNHLGVPLTTLLSPESR